MLYRKVIVGFLFLLMVEFMTVSVVQGFDIRFWDGINPTPFFIINDNDPANSGVLRDLNGQRNIIVFNSDFWGANRPVGYRIFGQIITAWANGGFTVQGNDITIMSTGDAPVNGRFSFQGFLEDVDRSPFNAGVAMEWASGDFQDVFGGLVNNAGFTAFGEVLMDSTTTTFRMPDMTASAVNRFSPVPFSLGWEGWTGARCGGLRMTDNWFLGARDEIMYPIGVNAGPVVPEPSTIIMFASTLCGVILFRREL